MATEWAIPAGRIRLPDNFQKQLPAAAIVLLLHLVFFAFIQVRPAIYDTPAPERETVLTLPLIPLKKQDIAPTPKTVGTGTKKSAGTFILPAPTEAPLDFSNLNLLLNSCGPENIGRLSPEQRTRCRAVAPLDMNRAQTAADFSDVSKAKRAGVYAREVTKKQAPLLLPCASPKAISVSIGTLICLGDLIINGYDADKDPGYVGN